MALQHLNKTDFKKCGQILVSIVRNSSEHRMKKTGQKKASGFKNKPDVSMIDRDYIGPPDKVSNLRPIVRHAPENETALQKKLRLARIEAEEWNQLFWAKHNQRFVSEKNAFVKAHKKPEEDTISADKMSEFYKTFLDNNWKSHFNYNREWYKRNFDILLLSYRTKFEIQNWFRRRS